MTDSRLPCEPFTRYTALRRSILLLPLLFAVLLLAGCSRDAAENVPRYAFGVISTDSRGNAYSEAAHGYYAEGTEITAHAVPAEGSAFRCWTVGAALEDGGSIVSYRKDFTFSLTEDLWLYPNFREHDKAHILYHANGGTAVDPDAGSQADTRWEEFSLDYYLYPNALPELGYFTRDGCTLVGYSTEPDGGELYTPGGKIFEDTDAVIELWCVWSEQSPSEDFSWSYDDTAGGWVVDAYTGPGGEVSVPSSHDGGPVIRLAPGSFAGNTGVTSLILPPSLRVVGDGSCSDMTALESLLFFDSLDYISDAAFAGDTALDTVYIGAATNPHYSDWFNSHAKKIEIMQYWRDDERPMMIILGGSSTAYAVDAQQLESLLSRDYVVLNCGTNGANLFQMASTWAMRFMDEGDFLLQIAEYSAWQLGGIECEWETFRSFEGCYNVFSWIDLSEYEKFFDAFSEFLAARRTMPEESYEDYVSYMAGTTGYFDIQGTLTVQTQPNGSDDFWQGRTLKFRGNWLHDYMVDNLNARYAALDGMGIDYALAFTPLNRNALDPEQTDENMEAFEQYLAENLHVAVISDLQENIMDPAVFYDDDYHLASPARSEYTERLAGDLNELFASLDGTK